MREDGTDFLQSQSPLHATPHPGITQTSGLTKAAQLFFCTARAQDSGLTYGSISKTNDSGHVRSVAFARSLLGGAQMAAFAVRPQVLWFFRKRVGHAVVVRNPQSPRKTYSAYASRLSTKRLICCRSSEKRSRNSTPSPALSRKFRTQTVQDIRRFIPGSLKRRFRTLPIGKR